MEKSIIINSKEYKVPDINFGAICDLENYGVRFDNIQDKSFNFLRGLVAYTIGCNLEQATKEIESHINNGGSFNDFVPLIEAISKSDFLKNLSKKQQKQN